MAKFYLTTAIDYSNGDPHLGHALEKVGADCIARWRRMRGDEVHFLMGMDEHSQSVIAAAEENRSTPQDWVDNMAARFSMFWDRLGCSHDDWIRTTETRHIAAVQHLLERIAQKNPDDLFLGEYQGLYCNGCEEYKQDSQIVDGRCVEHPTLELVETKETNHFFRLSRYGERVHQLITSGQLAVEPEIRRNEVVRLLERGLEDISVSRSRFPWGIPFPSDPDHTVYVWFDALINYLSATGYPAEGYDRLWPADLHVIGKGITRFHCVIWPAMLLAAELELPGEVWAHGYVQWEGSKMSKSSGTAVDLDTAIDRHGADPLRYFLMREIGFEADGNFTWDRFDERYTSDLADGLGNLASRTLAMLAKYRSGVIPSGRATTLDEAGTIATEEYRESMDCLDLRKALEAAWRLVSEANLYVTESAPWTLAKNGQDQELDEVMGSLSRALLRLALMIAPFMPGKAQDLWLALGQTGSVSAQDWDEALASDPSGAETSRGEPLFPKPPKA